MLRAIVIALMLTGTILGSWPGGAAAQAQQFVDAGRTPVPSPPKGQGDHCVRDTDFMRRYHMTMLKQQRDATVHLGIRTTGIQPGELRHLPCRGRRRRQAGQLRRSQAFLPVLPHLCGGFDRLLRMPCLAPAANPKAADAAARRPEVTALAGYLARPGHDSEPTDKRTALRAKPTGAHSCAERAASLHHHARARRHALRLRRQARSRPRAGRAGVREGSLGAPDRPQQMPRAAAIVCVRACREENGWNGSGHAETDPQWIRKVTLRDPGAARGSSCR